MFKLHTTKGRGVDGVCHDDDNSHKMPFHISVLVKYKMVRARLLRTSSHLPDNQAPDVRVTQTIIQG